LVLLASGIHDPLAIPEVVANVQVDGAFPTPRNTVRFAVLVEVSDSHLTLRAIELEGRARPKLIELRRSATQEDDGRERASSERCSHGRERTTRLALGF
jgi:hypothetical protein